MTATAQKMQIAYTVLQITRSTALSTPVLYLLLQIDILPSLKEGDSLLRSR